MTRILIAAALAASLLPVSARAQGAAPPPAVSVARPIVRDVVEWTDFIGRFEAVDAVDIRARVAGFL
ncbi:MAG: efflux transporter periplasmic adaptor subunit, partial [Alphaproteobacteria bacterium]|nr:efflux transporter periplasmic adaptor subunit [Alphaproteobacteria bacterium]